MKKEKKTKSIAIYIRNIAIALIILFIAAEGILQIFVATSEYKIGEAPGNDAIYNASRAEQRNSLIRDKTIIFLGSSVTMGQTGTSFVECLEARDGVNAIKEARSGTTLTDNFSPMAFLAFGNGNSYVNRIKKIDPTLQVDCLVCQLSTNDATLKKPLGEISDSVELNELDTKTIIGAMEYIIAYTKETWNCPVVFYTGAYFENECYAEMVDVLFELQEKWDIGIIDMYTNETFNDIDEETYKLYMNDEIHPTKAGYLVWWTPKMEEYLETYLVQK